jgi:3-(3-hydroxy-phenyl)propionate hydroxylase
MERIPERVLISGGGPVGLICAYALAQENIPVIVFDENSELQEDPRAATTHPATLELLAGLDLVGKVIEQGLICPIFRFWDRPTGNLVAEFDHELLRDDTDYPYVVQCEQFKLTRILVDLMRSMTAADIRFSHRVTSVSQDDQSVSIEVDSPNGINQFKGRYLIGSDGGRSTVRTEAKIPFEGFTWAERFLVLSTPFDFEAQRGMCHRNYISDPEEWCNCFKVAGDGPPGLWRTVYPESAEVPEADLLTDEYIQNKLQNFFPSRDNYDIVHRNLYTVHQRVAATFRKGRVMIAGDAAHVNNSIGGMGLNGGIQDAVNLAEKLIEVWKSGASDSLLDKYNDERRTFAIEFVQAQTIQNKNRLEAKAPKKRKKFLDELQSIAADPKRARQFMLKSSMIEAMRRIQDRNR